MHALDLVVEGVEGGSATNRLNKKYLSMPDNTKLSIAKGPNYRHRCRLFQREVGVVVYLFLLAGYDEKGKVDEETSHDPVEGTASLQTNLEEFFDEEEEVKMEKETSLSMIRNASSTIDISKMSRNKGTLPLPLLPSFLVDNKEFLLL